MSAQEDGAAALFDMSIEELGAVRVTTMFRRAQSLEQTPASVFVITADEIRRSGVTSIPEALRLAPGVEVTRNGAHSWTISIRGFNSDLSNKLLVLLDGRSVYSPLYAGVFWDVQDTLLADVDRIEVISGPGGTAWGANAVNGVINIITKTGDEALGGYAQVGGGGREGGFAAFRYGATLGEHATARAYVKHHDRDATELPAGGSAFDDTQFTQAGFNVGWDVSDRDRLTIRGDVYDGAEGDILRGDFTIGTLPDFAVPGEIDVSGANLLARWRRRLENDASLRLQVFYDQTGREIPGSFNEDRETIDLDFQHDLAAHGRHTLAWGTGLRVTSDELDNTLFASFLPPNVTDRLLTAFFQDRIALSDGRYILTLGTKLESNDYTGFEHQPNARFTWLIDDDRSFWAAVSRAVRTPARLNTDLRLFAPIPGSSPPLYLNVNGNPEFAAENLLAYEAGYRLRIGADLSVDVAVFDNFYDELQSIEVEGISVVPTPVTHLVLAASLANGIEGETYGGTVVVNWQPLERWRLRFQYARLEMDLRNKPGSTDTGGLSLAGNSPNHQLSIYSSFELPQNLSLYAAARYVDSLPSIGIDSYLGVDFNLAWTPSERFRGSLTVQNLNDRRHLEFENSTFVERSAYLRLVWTF